MPVFEQAVKIDPEHQKAFSKMFPIKTEKSDSETEMLLRELIQEIRELKQEIKIAEIKRDPLYRKIEQELLK